MLTNLPTANADADPCWEGYQQVGMKTKGGKEVPNCVPDEAELPASEKAPIDPQGGAATRAAGIMFANAEGEVLFIRRGNGGDYPGTWAVPGGHLNEGEDDESAARREVREETGIDYQGPLERLHDDGQFVTFHARGVEKYPVVLNYESSGYDWAKPADAPQPMHPGVVQALKVGNAHTELDVARLMADGTLPSPQAFANMHLLALRITGTGLAYRSSIGEHVWRDASLYLNQEFLDRCNGLTVIRDHPDTAVLDDKEFKDRAIGSVMLPYIKGDEVWGIARIYNEKAMAEICQGEVSTSPSVVFDSESNNATLRTESGEPLLIEGQGFLLDHIAIVTAERGGLGVWDKGGPATGVEITNLEEITMTTETAAKADAAGDALAQILAAVNAVAEGQAQLTARMDSMEKKSMPAEMLESKKDEDMMADAAEKEEMKEEAKPDAKEGVEGGKSGEIKEDADCKMDEDEKAAAADAEAAEYADAQAKADSVMAAFGKQASRPLSGETLMSYRKRLLRGLQAHSDSWKAVDLKSIKDASVLSIAEKQIFADAVVASKEKHTYADGQLYETVTKDRAGRNVSTFTGHIGAWLDQFKIEPQRVAQFNTPGAQRR